MKKVFPFIVLVTFVCVSLIVNAQTPSDSLIIHYTFTGNANDVSGYGNHADVYGPTLTYDRFGYVNHAYDFDGINDFMEILPISNLSQVGDFTVAVWVKGDGWNLQYPLDGMRDRQYIFDGCSNYNYVTTDYYREGVRVILDYTTSFDEQLHNTIVYSYPNVLNNHLATNTSLSLMGDWHHIVFQREDNLDKTYFDGVLITSTYSVQDQRADILDMNHPLYIGSGFGNNQSMGNNWNYCFDGTIDDFRFYKTALSPTEIYNLYIEETCIDTLISDTLTFFVSSLDYQNISPLVYLMSEDSLISNIGGCDSVINIYYEFIFDPNYCTDTVTIYDSLLVTVPDTMLVMDTTFITETVYVIDTIFVTDSIAVTDTLIIDVVLEGINPPNNINTIKVYPNPANDYVIINTGNFGLMNNYVLKIYNSNGQNVYETLFNQQELQIDVNDLGSIGTYFIYIYNSLGEIVETRKLILI